MMIARIYGLLWVIAAVVGGGLYVTDSFNMTTTIIFGFFVSVLTGSALLVVFPSLMSESVSAGR